RVVTFVVPNLPEHFAQLERFRLIGQFVQHSSARAFRFAQRIQKTLEFSIHDRMHLTTENRLQFYHRSRQSRPPQITSSVPPDNKPGPSPHAASAPRAPSTRAAQSRAAVAIATPCHRPAR